MAAKSSKCILCGGRTSCDLLLLSDFFRLQFAIVIGLISFSKYITQFEIRHVIDKCWWWRRRSLTFERKRLKLVLIYKLTKNVWQKLCHDVPCMFFKTICKNLSTYYHDTFYHTLYILQHNLIAYEFLVTFTCRYGSFSPFIKHFWVDILINVFPRP